MSGSSWTGGIIGGFGGVPVIESPFVPAGQAYVVSSPFLPLDLAFRYGPSYLEPPETIKGHIQRKANEIRRRWGMAEVDYAAEYERERMDRIWAYAAEQRLALRVREPGSIVASGL